MLAIKTILHPTDFSEVSGQALELACGLAADYQARLVIIHVMPAPVVLPDCLIEPDPERGRSVFRARLADLDAPAPSGELGCIEDGNPAAEILSLAQLCQADLIVMGSHGRRGLPGWLLGSVAEAVLRQAACPVITVTPQLATQPQLGPLPLSQPVQT